MVRAMKKLGKMLFLCCAALLAPVPAAAADAWQWDVGLGGDVRWFDWREYRDGEELLVESGPLALGRGDLHLQYSDFYTGLAFSWGGGKVQYDGQLHNGTPYQSDAWEQIMETELQVGWQQAWGNLHLGLMQRDWHRTIEGNAAQNVSSAEERYRWHIAMVGGEVLVYSSPAWKASLSVDAGVPIMSFQKVYGGVYDAFEVQPGDGVFWRVSLPFRRAGERASFSITPYLQYQDMDESSYAPAYIDGVPVLDNGNQVYLYQPESERLEGGVSLRISLGR